MTFDLFDNDDDEGVSPFAAELWGMEVYDEVLVSVLTGSPGGSEGHVYVVIQLLAAN